MTIDPLFATQAVAPLHRAPPVIVVGMARSGSSFLSHVISCIDDWYIFDDLYLYAQAKSIGATSHLTAEQLEQLIVFLGWQLKARIKWETNFPAPRCTWEEADKMSAALRKTFEGKKILWHELLEEWLVRLALHHGKSRWGYKTPQDFLHMSTLNKVFPGTRFIFIVRDPRQVMASLKNVPSRDGKPGQYHPLPYAFYWRMASRFVQKQEKELGIPVHTVLFESLIKDPDLEAKKIADFLDSPPPQKLPSMKTNTSFSGGRRQDITETEKWFCEKILRKEMGKFGYEIQGSRPRFADLPDIAKTTWRFIGYQFTRLFQKSRPRYSVLNFLRALLTGRPH